MITKILATLMMLGMLGTLSACNTVAGAGKDIERAGDKIHDTARDTQQKM